MAPRAKEKAKQDTAMVGAWYTVRSSWVVLFMFSQSVSESAHLVIVLVTVIVSLGTVDSDLGPTSLPGTTHMSAPDPDLPKF